MAEPKTLLLSYLAGIIDGEGSIFISKTTVKSTRSPAYSVKCACQMMDKQAVLLLKKHFGGYYSSKYKAKSGRRVYAWSVASNVAARAVETLYPYLRIKKAQARLLIKAQKLITKRKYRVSKLQNRQKQSLFNQLRNLHGK